jgi:hypothetical protein
MRRDWEARLIAPSLGPSFCCSPVRIEAAQMRFEVPVSFELDEFTDPSLSSVQRSLSVGALCRLYFL